ncbi:vWA domain-containing protein [Velocimicrobium porci]|uniref:VWA domain-containing protein n=1 Tax=Velocimicrobium porci TaxID=2606634 RepID=A0A6L5XZY2_9FIRM|nr:VWA domain-containing protein [Velocimicrobium porci]MSS63758.1 VWA domain-containing protein [Velocimicrobium porci]
MQKEDYKKLKRLGIVGVLFTILFAVTLTNYIREQQKEKLETEIREDTKQLNEIKKQFHEYRILKNSKEKKRYNTLLTNYQTGILNQDTALIDACQKELKELKKEVIQKNTSYYKAQVEKLEKGNLDNAYDNELERIEEIKMDIKHHINQNTFRQIDPLLKEWKKLLKDMTSIADNLTIHVRQTDTKAYPTTQMYLSVHNISTDQVPDNLEKRYFYLTKQIGSNPVEKLSIDSIKKVNDSGQHMINFVTSIKNSTKQHTLEAIIKSANQLFEKSNFESGSQIELLNSYNGIQLLQPFTSDKKNLRSKIKTLQSSKANNLYDLLYTAVKHTANKSGAKYIIAFTDGEDNSSRIDYPKVVETANHYQIPIYLIGIGDQISTYTLERIATQTGGFYRNINDNTLIKDIIDNILAEQNDLYQLTYTEKDIKNDISDLVHSYKMVIAYQNRAIGGTEEAIVSPVILLSNSSHSSSFKSFEQISTTIRGILKKQIKTEKLGTLLSFEFKTIKKLKQNLYKAEVISTAQKINSNKKCQLTTQESSFLLKKKKNSYKFQKQLNDMTTSVSLS